MDFSKLNFRNGSSHPLYSQLLEALESAIESEALAIGTRLPSDHGNGRGRLSRRMWYSRAERSFTPTPSAVSFCYTWLPPDKIEAGVRRLAETVKTENRPAALGHSDIPLV